MIIVPRPQKMTVFNGKCSIKDGLITSENNYKKIGKDAQLLGIGIKEGNPGEENIFFYEDAALKEEEYELLVNVGGINIISGSEQGRFRALSTLRQILAQKEENSIPCLKIHDYPDIKVRGIMLYMNSSCIYKTETLKYFIDRLSELKYNMLQLYFDTFVFEYDSFRNHLDNKVYYTKDEIKELDTYCKERHIELMANVETFGHLKELLSCEEYKHLGITIDGEASTTINPLLEESFEVIKKMLDDLLPCFSSPVVNIGMDETYGMGENETKEYCKAFGVDGLFIEFLTKVSRYIKEKHGKRSMIWGDMAAKHPESMCEIPKEVIFVDWGYEPGHKFDRNAVECKKAGLDYYVAPGTHMWATFTGRTDVMVRNIFEAAESARHYGAEGFLLTDWTASRPSLLTLPLIYAGAFSWNSGDTDTVSEAQNEQDCNFRYAVSDDVLYYYDKCIAKSSEKSCAELVYRMGNYWFMEQPQNVATWNGTILCKNFASNDYDYSKLTKGQLQGIKNYMKEIRNELNECKLGADNAEEIMKELTTCCDLVIFAAEALIKNYCVEYDCEINAETLLDNYKYLSENQLKYINEPGMIRLIKKYAKIN